MVSFSDSGTPFLVGSGLILFNVNNYVQNFVIRRNNGFLFLKMAFRTEVLFKFGLFDIFSFNDRDLLKKHLYLNSFLQSTSNPPCLSLAKHSITQHDNFNKNVNIIWIMVFNLI